MSRQPYRLALRALPRPIPTSLRCPPPNLLQARLASSLPSARPPMPPDMPRENYAEPTLYTLSYLSRIIRLLLYSALGISAAGLVGFEGLHLYIEHRLMATPSVSTDEFGWAGENVSWTNRRGGTDPRLGWKARHALRGAWICQEWGAGGPAGSIGRSIHPGPRSGTGVEVNRVDRGYELAEEYIDLAIREAEKRGIVLGKGKADEVAVDLLLLKAGVLERLATEQSLLQAKKVYQDVLDSLGEEEVARAVKLSGKIGDLAQRTGGDGRGWWTAGLQRAGVELPAEGKKGWFATAPPTTSAPTLPPAVLRAVVGLLISTEAHLATSAQYADSARIQSFALSLLPPSTPSLSPSATLQNLWVSHRTALITLHSASVAYAQKLPSAITSATTAANLIEGVIPQIPSPSPSDPLAPSARLLASDAQALAAEANYIRGVLLEKAKDLDTAGECFERAMGHAGERGKEWDRYWKAFARVREKLEKQRGVVA